jgi:hypothetical protein
LGRRSTRKFFGGGRRELIPKCRGSHGLLGFLNKIRTRGEENEGRGRDGREGWGEVGGMEREGWEVSLT